MSAVVLLPIVAASLLGSLHCAGMCGGFVAVYSAGDASGGVRRLLPHLAYHAGRLFTYVALGTAAGALGAALDLAGKAAGVGRVAGVIAGAIMVLWAAALLLERAGWQRAGSAGPVRRRFVRLMAGFTAKPPLARALLLGLSSTLLPCGWLYAFAVAAAGTGGAFGGALVMGAFWLGTVPMLLGLGLGVQAIAPRLRRHVPVISAVVLLVVGLAGVVGRFNVPAMAADASRTAITGKPACHH